MPDSDKEDRTEAPSQQRLEAAREEGQVAISRELQSLVVLGAGLSAVAMFGPEQFLRMVGDGRRLAGSVGTIDAAAGLPAVMHEMISLTAGLAGPPVMAAALGLVAITLLQTGFLLRPQALMPQFNRVNPMNGIKRIFGGDNLVETLKALAKLSVFVVALTHVLSGSLPLLANATRWDVGTLACRTAKLVLHALLTLIAVQLLIAVLDTGWVRYRHVSKLRMTRQELRDEHRQSEGDPHVKGRIRQMRRQRAKRRMMDAVPGATVVITNPTHYAVALVYENGGKGAPRVVAKGVDELAARIRELAIDSRVPLVANPPLARALYTVPLDAEIPREHFQVVAGIIAYVWRLKRPAPVPPPLQ